MNFELTVIGMVVESGEELAAVFVGEKNRLSIMATLGDVELSVAPAA